MSKNTPDQSSLDGQESSALGGQQNVEVSGSPSEGESTAGLEQHRAAVGAQHNSPLPPPASDPAQLIWRGDPPPTQHRRLLLVIFPILFAVGLFLLIAITSGTSRPELVDDENPVVLPSTTTIVTQAATTSTPAEESAGASQTSGVDPTVSEGVTSVQWVEAEQVIRVDYLLDLERDRDGSFLQQSSSGDEWRDVILLEGRSGHVNVPVEQASRGKLEEFRVFTRYSDGSELVTVPRGVFSSPSGSQQLEASSWATWSSGGTTGWRQDDGYVYVGWMDSVRGAHSAIVVFPQRSSAEGFRPEQASLRIGRSTGRGCTGDFVLKYAQGDGLPETWQQVGFIGETAVAGPVEGQYVDVSLPSEALDIIETGSGLLIAIMAPNSDRASSCSAGSTYRVFDSPSVDQQSMVLTVSYR